MDAYILIGRYIKDKLTMVRAVLKTDLTSGIRHQKSRSCGPVRALSCSYLTLRYHGLLNQTNSSPVDQHCVKVNKVVTFHLYIRSLNKQLRRQILGRFRNVNATVVTTACADLKTTILTLNLDQRQKSGK